MDEWSTFKEPVRIGMMASLLYATYLVAMCPCEKPVGCKQGQFYLAIALPAAATFVINLSTSIKNE